MIAEILVVDKAPLTTGILIRPAVTLTWEVNPLRMSELVTHEVQITAINGSTGHETDHLMQGDTTLSQVVHILLGEVPVHIGINQTEDDGLVANECLIVALAIRDGLLVRTTVLNLPENRADIDILIAYLFNSLNPVVRDIHRHTVVKAVTAILKLGSESRHT